MERAASSPLHTQPPKTAAHSAEGLPSRRLSEGKPRLPPPLSYTTCQLLGVKLPESSSNSRNPCNREAVVSHLKHVLVIAEARLCACWRATAACHSSVPQLELRLEAHAQPGRRQGMARMRVSARRSIQLPALAGPHHTQQTGDLCLDLVL